MDSGGARQLLYAPAIQALAMRSHDSRPGELHPFEQTSAIAVPERCCDAQTE